MPRIIEIEISCPVYIAAIFCFYIASHPRGIPLRKKRSLIMKLKSLVLGVLCSLCAAIPAQAAESVTINGSTTVLPIIQKASEHFMASYPDISIVLSGGGSGTGIKSLLDGITDVAMSSRDVKESEKSLAAGKKVELTRTVIAVDALVPIVNPRNTVKDLSIEQLRDIFSGKITNWKEVGGSNSPIVVVNRDNSSGTYECWKELVMKDAKVIAKALTQASNGGVVQNVATNANAIGYIGMGYLNSNVKGLSISGIKATSETALAKKWPLSRELYLFTNGKPAGTTAKFMNFMLDAGLGQQDVLKAGYIPLAK